MHGHLLAMSPAHHRPRCLGLLVYTTPSHCRAVAAPYPQYGLERAATPQQLCCSGSDADLDGRGQYHLPFALVCAAVGPACGCRRSQTSLRHRY